MQHQGTLTFWNDDRGFGFITPRDSSEQVFVHISSFKNPFRRPSLNLEVTYTLSQDDKGRPRAGNVSTRRDAREAGSKRNGVALALLLAGLYLSALFLATDSGKVPKIIFAISTVMSGIAFLLYAHDKSAAKKHRWRTPEVRLHLVAAAGGWPGALVAQQLFRHKTKKISFQVLFWLSVIGNIAMILWLTTPSGAERLHSWGLHF